MDTVTQLTLGAAVGEATLGHKVGSRAILWGAICGTLPDMDVFVPLGDAVRDFTYHRSASHSLLVLAALTPLMVWLILKAHPQSAEHRRGWFVLVYLTFVTHVVLDCFTVYGTQIFWPLDDTPVAWASVFIIDPAYTLPLAIGVLAALVLSRRQSLGHRLNWIGLSLSTCYLAWTLAAKLHVEQVAKESLARRDIAYERLLTVPAPLTSLVWRVVAVGTDRYHTGYYSLLDEEPNVAMQSFPSKPELLSGIEDSWAVERLKWFTKGFYSVSMVNRAIVITDLRMGVEGSYAFRFIVGTIGNPHATQIVAPLRLAPVRDYGRLKNVWARIWDSDAKI